MTYDKNNLPTIDLVKLRAAVIKAGWEESNLTSTGATRFTKTFRTGRLPEIRSILIPDADSHYSDAQDLARFAVRRLHEDVFAFRYDQLLNQVVNELKVRCKPNSPKKSNLTNSDLI